MNPKILAVALVALTVLALSLPLLARTSAAQSLREDLTIRVEILAEDWADRPPRLEEVVFVKVARAIVFIIDLMD